MEKTQPKTKVKKGSISIAMFENQYGKSLVVQKSYKQKNGEWKNSSINLFESELGDLKEAIKEYEEKAKAPETA